MSDTEQPMISIQADHLSTLQELARTGIEELQHRQRNEVLHGLRNEWKNADNAAKASFAAAESKKPRKPIIVDGVIQSPECNNTDGFRYEENVLSARKDYEQSDDGTAVIFSDEELFDGDNIPGMICDAGNDNGTRCRTIIDTTDLDIDFE